jgi:hypothetical protein
MFHLFSTSIDCEIFTQSGMRFEEKNLNLIQIINDYGVKNKHDLTKHAHYML